MKRTTFFKSTNDFSQLAIITLGLLVSWFPISAKADLVLEMPFVFTLGAGDTATVAGRITNTTGVPLNASDLFFDFNQFDPTVFGDVTQILGTPDFVLPNLTRSPVTNLFQFSILSTAAAGTYPFAVTLQDINNNFSNTTTLQVTVQTPIIPEPAGSLLSIALVGFILVGHGGRLTKKRVNHN